MQMQVKVLLGAALVLAGGLGFVAGRVTSNQSGQEEVLRELHRQRELLVEHLSRQQAGPPPTRFATASDRHRRQRRSQGRPASASRRQGAASSRSGP
jgi:hypothetical protein